MSDLKFRHFCLSYDPPQVVEDPLNIRVVRALQDPVHLVLRGDQLLTDRKLDERQLEIFPADNGVGVKPQDAGEGRDHHDLVLGPHVSVIGRHLRFKIVVTRQILVLLLLLDLPNRFAEFLLHDRNLSGEILLLLKFVFQKVVNESLLNVSLVLDLFLLV